MILPDLVGSARLLNGRRLVMMLANTALSAAALTYRASIVIKDATAFLISGESCMCQRH